MWLLRERSWLKSKFVGSEMLFYRISGSDFSQRPILVPGAVSGNDRILFSFCKMSLTSVSYDREHFL